jgi:CRISPR-associated endonuclease/helicase Cas3
MTLTADDFADVFGAIHRVPPFAWQTRLLRTVIEQGWPATIAAPTGTGKTAVLDVALFHLALAMSGASCHPAPRRIVFAVDRRVIVDQAFVRARKLRKALVAASDARVAAMAAALTAAGDEPLHVEVLRGGMPREDVWARSPIQPTILCTTVDQLGSRLLFRGYGVSPSMAPVHAGLLGEDALLLLDEAHLSEPFHQTLQSVEQRRVKLGQDATRPWAFCTLTATPRDTEDRIFRLSDDEAAEPSIAIRLAAAKTAELELCKERAGSSDHLGAFVAAGEQLVQQCTQATPTIAIIVNRVALARSVLQALQRGGHDVILFTGRVRPVEREHLLHGHERRLTSRSGCTETQAEIEAPTRPLFVVATQCIEAGADFDFDAMVTEIAPLDALRQRFGRLNRLGLRERGPAIIIAAKDEIARGADDRLYRGCLRETWEWLLARAAPPPARGRPTIEISPQAFETLVSADPDAAARCVVVAKDAPVLRAADVALLAMTNPRPQPDPFLPPFLHGEVQSETDVSIVWRADCEIIASPPEKDAAKVAAAIVACQRPVPGEALRVPIWAAQAWLSQSSGNAADVTDAGAEREPDPGNRPSGGRLALRWRGIDSDDTALIRAAALRPGDVIVVPSSYGGCDRFGWAPASTAPVDDIADEAAQPYASRYFSLRLHSELWAAAGFVPWDAVWSRLQEYAADRDNAAPIIHALRDMGDLPPRVRDAVERLIGQTGASRPRIECPYDDDHRPSGAVLIAPRGVAAEGDTSGKGSDASTEDDETSLFKSGRVPLTAHIKAVVDQAGSFAEVLRLPARLAKTLVFAAQHHDDGKADPRFQAWLAGSETPSTELLAKGGQWRGVAAELAARAAAGVPERWRHEVLSVRVAIQHLAAFDDDIDQALALYLIGTHHGHGRPFFPHHDTWDAHARPLLNMTIAAGPGPERLDFSWQGRDWAELFADLQAQYGPWGLAFLEAVLRLADHRASERRT